ncbi:M17 family metallopeptidase [Oscillibacter sp.]|jgi:leucyl aminopeptidase|uniref:leucyl aminopeptidase family protein n=1 Tax=Oscillibacter sp. TaxID=1945593 RepID=UPI002172FA9D|nr:leucyl aminopeptidase [Oscillibacter sp.]MCI9648226.1 leucyl aminopeptidase [Oscillibacter sp.]
MKLSLCQVCWERDWDGVVLPLGPGALERLEIRQARELDTLRGQNIFSGQRGELYQFTVFRNGGLCRWFLVGLGEKWGLEEMLSGCARAYRLCHELNLARVCTEFAGLGSEMTPALLQKAAEAAILSGYRFERYKPKSQGAGIQEAAFCCAQTEEFRSALRDAEIGAGAACMARDLINEPPNIMTPECLAQSARRILADTSVKVRVYGREETAGIGLSAFLEVGKGSLREPKLIVMEYMGDPGRPERRLGLIGKGLTYDSGGYSLQSSEFMETMQHDMSGGAAVIGALWAAQARGLAVNVTGIIAACENKLSASAYVPGDVIPSMSGRYIEVNNTDAEGRITLADAVTYAKRCCGVDRIIDIATLTDGIQTALGNRRCGLFTNHRDLAAQVEAGARAACERVWELPCDENLRAVLDSRVSSLKNSAMGSSVGGYATVGAMFVKEFVEETPWVHLDIGGTAWSLECEGIYAKGGVGFGTRLLYETLRGMEKE